jgi:ABC-type sugar transport system ATPase subunit
MKASGGRIELVNIGKSFGPVEVIGDVSLTIGEGDLIVFVGPSGCGKSTLLRLIAGLDRPTRGRVLIDGRDVTEVGAADRGLAMVFQSYALYPHMTVRQNLSFGLENTRTPRAEIAARVAEAARMLEITELLERRPTQLSGGQRQRVAIGRAIVRDPTAFLLDEPLSNLDAELRGSMRAELAALHARLATTMIYVTHDQVEAMTLADRIVVLRKGQVEQVDTPLGLFNRPANLFVAGFIGAPNMNFFPGVARGGQATLPGGLTVPVAAEGAVTLGVRPQHLRLSDRGMRAEVTLVEALGAETVIHALAEGTRVLVVVQGQPRVVRGDVVHLDLDPAQAHVFGADGRRIELPPTGPAV